MIEHFFSSGVYAKQTKMPAGVWLVQHNHNFDHMSILASGSAKLMVDDTEKTIHAPACLTIEANKHHGVLALTDCVWYCIHATNCTDAEKVDDTLIAPSKMNEVAQLAQALKGE